MSGQTYSIVWTETAARDLERLAAYLWSDSPLRAGDIVDRIITRAESLHTSPFRGRMPPELETVGDRTWREVMEPPWRIVYKVGADRVEIHGVLDGRRSLQDILMERLLRG